MEPDSNSNSYSDNYNSNIARPSSTKSAIRVPPRRLGSIVKRDSSQTRQRTSPATNNILRNSLTLFNVPLVQETTSVSPNSFTQRTSFGQQKRDDAFNIGEVVTTESPKSSRQLTSTVSRLSVRERELIRDETSDEDNIRVGNGFRSRSSRSSASSSSRSSSSSSSSSSSASFSSVSAQHINEADDIVCEMAEPQGSLRFGGANTKQLRHQISGDSNDAFLATTTASASMRSGATTPHSAASTTSDAGNNSRRRRFGDKKSLRSKFSRVFSDATVGLFGSTTTWRLDLEINGGGGCGAEQSPNPLRDRFNKLKLWTKQTQLPTLYGTAKEVRFILRTIQLVCICACFGSLSVGTFRANYMSSILSNAGVNFMMFTSISAAFNSISWIIVYTNPSTLGIPPHRHPRISRIELLLDTAFLALWISACINISYEITPRICDPVVARCVSWDVALFFGYAAGAAFGSSVVLGAWDVRRYDEVLGVGGGGADGAVMVEAKGGWVQAKVLRKSKDGVKMLVDEFDD
ncbi:hypothetical protein HK100_005096 [Physocladia obscura]|uniref:MARVEL domain-containing protein n=1 Tax=Physocladia obscura TaxID=109957 RepID=A0AAD5SS37_9FUNG|nr:hypothetical protein HK100_005096 [Physocladia obscura]